MSDGDLEIRDDAERSVLGSCLLSEQAIHDSVQVVASRDFYALHHSTIFAVITALWQAGQPVEPLTVAAALADTNDLARVGGAPYLHRLIAGVGSPRSASHYARIVLQHSRRRQLLELASHLERAADMDDEARRAALLDQSFADLEHLVSGQGGRDPVETLLGDMMDTADLSSLAALDPLVPGVLYRDSLAWLAGRPGRGKTLVAIDIAGSIGTGTPWQGMPVCQGEVWYVIAEGIRGLRDRVRAWEHLASRPMTGVRFLPHPVQAADPAQWRTICRAARRRRPSLIILDTQARISVGMDENDGKDMGQLVERLDELRTASEACVMTIHHTPRGGGHVRGHSAIEGAAQTIIMVAKDDNVLTLHNTEEEGGKQKDAEPFAPIHLRITPAGNHVALTLTDRASAPADLGSAAVREFLTQWWDLHGDDAVSVTTLVASGIPKSTFYKYKRKLITLAVIEVVGKEGKGHNPRYKLAKDPSADE